MEGLNVGGTVLSWAYIGVVEDDGECVLFDFRWRNILRREYGRFFSDDDGEGDTAAPGRSCVIPFPDNDFAVSAASIVFSVEPDNLSSCTGNENPLLLPLPLPFPSASGEWIGEEIYRISDGVAVPPSVRCVTAIGGLLIGFHKTERELAFALCDFP